MKNKYKCPDCGEDMAKKEFELFNQTDQCICFCDYIKEIIKYKELEKKKIYKIGRYYYKEVAQDKNGEPKLKKGEEIWDNYNIFSLVDCEGNAIRYFRRIKLK